MVARLLDHFHISMDQLARLTDRQIYELYFHPRDDKGSIEPKDEPERGAATEEEVPTYKSELRNWWKLANTLKMLPEQRIAGERKLREKYGIQEPSGE